MRYSFAGGVCRWPLLLPARAEADIKEIPEPGIVQHQCGAEKYGREDGTREHEPKGTAGASGACPSSGMARRLPLDHCTPTLSPAIHCWQPILLLMEPTAKGRRVNQPVCQPTGGLANNSAEDEPQQVGDRSGTESDRELAQAAGQG
jgi:hypothetical protein